MSAKDEMARAASIAGIEHRPMRQGDFISQFGPDEQSGVCFGLAAAYLIYHSPAAKKLGLNFFNDVNEKIIEPTQGSAQLPKFGQALVDFITTIQAQQETATEPIRYKDPSEVPAPLGLRNESGIRSEIPWKSPGYRIDPGAWLRSPLEKPDPTKPVIEIRDVLQFPQSQKAMMLKYGFLFKDSTEVESEKLDDPNDPENKRKPSYKTLADVLAKSPSYNLVHIPKHTMATYCKGTLNSIHFFDSNGGEVRTKVAAKLARFFREYFHNDVINPRYLFDSLNLKTDTLECKVDTYTLA